MRRLILFRHSEAVRSSRLPDLERPLTDAGRKDAQRAAARLAKLALPIDLALISDSRRTVETWELARAAFAAPPEARMDHRLYEAERRDLMEVAREQPDSINSFMFVGHNPSVAEFAGHLVGRGEKDAMKRLGKGFPTSGIAVFELDVAEWRKLRWGDGELAFFLA